MEDKKEEKVQKNADFIESTSVFDEFLEFIFKDGIVAARNAQLGTKQPIPRIDGIDGSLEEIRNMRSGNFQQRHHIIDIKIIVSHRQFFIYIIISSDRKQTRICHNLQLDHYSQYTS